MLFKNDTAADMLLEVSQKFYVRFFFFFLISSAIQSVSFSLLSYCVVFIDLASGTTIDWVYATQNIPLAYTFEFRDSRNGK